MKEIRWCPVCVTHHEGGCPFAALERVPDWTEPARPEEPMPLPWLVQDTRMKLAEHIHWAQHAAVAMAVSLLTMLAGFYLHAATQINVSMEVAAENNIRIMEIQRKLDDIHLRIDRLDRRTQLQQEAANHGP